MTIAQSARLIADCIATQCSGKTLLLLSGGSSAKIGIAALQQLPQATLDQLTVTLSDERFVPIDSPDSNWNLLNNLGLNDIQVHKIAVNSPDALSRQETCSEFTEALQDALQNNNNIVAILGIGTDNHIAGILPNTIAAQSTAETAVEYTTDTFERITISPSFFTKIDHAFLYAEGTEKAAAIHNIETPLDPVAFPAQLLKKTRHWQVFYNEEKL